jgi:hypothetical protein
VCQLAERLVASDEPVDPENDQKHPDQLNCDQGEERMKYFSQQFHDTPV